MPTTNQSLIKCSYHVEVYLIFGGLGIKKPSPAKFALTMGVDSIYRELFAPAEEEKDELEGKNLRLFTAKSGMFNTTGSRLEEMYEQNDKKVRASDISVKSSNRVKQRKALMGGADKP